jgi:hypothetical protein
MTKDEAMKLALEAMERYQVKRQDFDRFADEITALREALAEQPAPVQPVSGFGLAAIGQKHFGNPIPKAWYAAARELMAGQPAQQEPDAIGCKCSECGAWQRWTPSGMVCKNGHGGVPGINHRLYTSPPAQQEPWGFHIQFNNGKDATFKGLDYLAECEAHLEAGETITMLYIKENT